MFHHITLGFNYSDYRIFIIVNYCIETPKVTGTKVFSCEICEIFKNTCVKNIRKRLFYRLYAIVNDRKISMILILNLQCCGYRPHKIKCVVFNSFMTEVANI